MYDLILFGVMLLLGFIFGQIAEKRHFRSIIQREQELRDILCFSERKIPEQGPIDAALVSGSVVISVDFFKRFVANLRNFIGGRVSAYESLLERARREAILRMKAEARARGATSVWNIRLETASISKNAAQGIGAVEVVAYGTAVTPR
ncbi:heavy metal-binding domain-containing protein [Dechloromonas sp. TW-R-39-2]|uniref:YbjQ family protein n=1 Tax=Dechloromonas sp. TW-R-39-2 TaxID=2654218 RepID=UPI00193DD660|nr:YbjQ family protein [Dechloromonas sp. TW-R-39-2]QRM19858.1 heavy metal-binding domain-containing protein [Dechloromonas sp. TW-R-39-2]